MALTTTRVALPKEVAAAIMAKAKDASTIGVLSPAEPQLFLDKDYLVFNGSAEAEVVAEGEQKSSYEEAPNVVVGKRSKVVTTTRVSEELKWADEDDQLQIVAAIQADQAAALGRVLDYIVYHAWDPKKKTALTGYTALTGAATAVTSTGKPADDLDALVEAVSDEFDFNGIALSKTWAAQLRKVRADGTGMRLFPEIPINLQPGALDGVTAAASGTVNGRLITPATKVIAIAGDFTKIRWGMVRDMTSEVIEYGDPDQSGKDLKANGQVAYRTQGLYATAVLDPKAFAVLKSK